jgi:hypothetical protein
MAQDTQQPQTIQQVIAQEFGFSDLDADRQERLIERMTESVIKRVLVDAYTKLSDSDRKQFEDLMENIENIDPNAIETFLREKLTDYDSIIAEAIADLKKHITETSTT